MEIKQRLKIAVSNEVKAIGQKAASRGHRAVQVIRNTELRVLKGTRSGRLYGKHRASAAGEAPAVKTGRLRSQWHGSVQGSVNSKGASVIPTLESKTPYAGILDKGTRRMASRPFKDRIAEAALPEVKKIFEESY